MSLLTIIQTAASDLTLPQPSSVINNNDPNVKQLLAFSRRCALDIVGDYDWQALTKEATFTTIAAETQDALTDIASDYDRMVNQTAYNRTRKWPVFGGRSSRSRAAEKGLSVSSLRDTMAIRGGNIVMIPAPTAGDTIAFDYISNQWCQSEAGTDQSDWAADSDVFKLDDEVLALGIICRFLRRKGFAYVEELRDYETRLQRAKNRDRARPPVDMSGPSMPRHHRVPEGDWNLS